MNHHHPQHQQQQQSSPSASSIPNAGGENDRASSPRSSAITRTGKIARLPQAIRQRLNERLADGEPQHLLVAWLNEHEVVRERLVRFHGGLLITEQNMSDWKAGGFRDWDRHQETRGMLREFLHEAEELNAELGEEELLEKTANSVTWMLVRLYQEALAAKPGPEQRKAVLQIARELNRMRRVSLEQQRVQLLAEKAHAPSNQPRLYREDWQEINRELEAAKKELAKDNAWLRVEAEALRAEYVAGMENRALSPERRKFIEEFYGCYESSVEALGLELLPVWREPKARVARKQPRAKRQGGRAKAISPAKATSSVKSTGSSREATSSLNGSEQSPDKAAAGGNPE
ncbi:MAG TPA: hypothetical protein VK968_15780 [Roseimicrobium sp.]|nr:hypothetical protein [Roseimicrobium sp.]